MDKKQFFEICRDAGQLVRDAVLVVKAHPNEKEETLRRFVEQLGFKEFVITKEVPLYSLFGISEGIVTLTSLASLEAMAFQVPVIVVALPGRNYDYYIPLRGSGAALCAGNAQELSEVFKSLASDPAYRQMALERGDRFVSQYIHRSGHEAANEIIGLLRGVLSKAPQFDKLERLRTQPSLATKHR